jgi:hypothetical protein
MYNILEIIFLKKFPMSRPSFMIFAQNYLFALLSNYGNVFLNEPIPRDPKLRVYKHPSRFGWERTYIETLFTNNPHILVSPEVVAEAKLVDVLFEPDINQSRTSLGLLGEFTATPCIIQPLRWTPDAWEIRTCISHFLAWTSESSGGIIPVNETLKNTDQEELEEEDNKSQLIIVPSIFPGHFQGFGIQPSHIPGVYNLPPIFCTTIVVTSELPIDVSTLWLRILGRGKTQRQVIIELFNSDIDDPLYTLARQQLQQWYQFLLQGDMGKESQLLMQTLASLI